MSVQDSKNSYRTNLHFLHSTRKREFLEQILNSGGLMFTDHDVEFSLSYAPADFAAMLNQVEPLIQTRTRLLGINWRDVPTEEKHKVYMGMGAISGRMPMLCFTEVLDERDLSTHNFAFGAYGIVVGQSWMEKNGGDRVVYVGENTALTRSLHQAMVHLRLGAMLVNNGQILFDKDVDPTILDLLQYVQVRKNLKEFEWRIPGAHGFFGGPRATNTRLTIGLSEIEHVLVQNEDDVQHFENIIGELASQQGISEVPKVSWQPRTIGSI